MTSPDLRGGRVPPLVEDLRAYYEREVASFHMPGHKQRTGGLHPLAEEVFGAAAIRADVSEMGGFDYLYAPDGPMIDAQRRAADTFGARQTFFLVNGSTVGNLAAVTAFASDASHVVLIRGSHRSVYTAVALCGAIPHCLPMAYNSAEDGWFFAEAPRALHLPGRLAVVHVTRPNYYGMACDLGPYLELARATGAMLIVDEAHGSHFGQHGEFPMSALQLGADVVIQSTHKTLGALTQASMLHIGTERVDVDRIARSLQMLQSSSPSALLTLSLDLAADHVATQRAAMFNSVVAIAGEVGDAVDAMPHLRRTRSSQAGSACDPTKLVIDVSGTGRNGFAAARYLKETCGVSVELADHRRIICSLTIGDTQESARVLIDALATLSAAEPGVAAPSGILLPALPPMDATPRAAMACPTEVISLDACADRTCAEYVIPYPPGIPLVVPGERLTVDVLDAIAAFRRCGSRIVGPADPSGERLVVVRA